MASNREKRLNQMAENGVVGAGGAGFPTHVKCNCQAEIVIANGAECEPLLHKDKQVMAKFPGEIVQAVIDVVKITGAREGIIAIKSKAKEAISAIEKEIRSPVKLHLLDDTYPAGDEFVLTYEVTGRIPPPGGLPIHVGAVVQNVETLKWIHDQTPVVDKWVTVAGAVNHPQTVVVPIGISIREVIEKVGGSKEKDFKVLAGGTMMGRLVTDLSEPITKVLGGLIVLSAEHPLIRRYSRSKKSGDKIARSACDQCSFCTQLCPRYLLGHPVQPHLAMRHIGMASPETGLPKGSKYCCGCNLCSFWSCPEDLDPGWITFDYRQKLQGDKSSTSEKQISKPHPMYMYRKPTINALKRRLGLDRFYDHAPVLDTKILPAIVHISLKQHVGVQATPTVKIGDFVNRGDLIGGIPKGALGANVHASINGTVREISEWVTIEGEEM